MVTIAVFFQEEAPNMFGHRLIGIEFPEFPGCLSVGENLEDALAMAKDALAGHLIDGSPDSPGIQVAVPQRIWVNIINNFMMGTVVNGSRIVALIKIPYKWGVEK
jgi:hypothetical protein